MYTYERDDIDKQPYCTERDRHESSQAFYGVMFGEAMARCWIDAKNRLGSTLRPDDMLDVLEYLNEAMDLSTRESLSITRFLNIAAGAAHNYEVMEDKP